MLYDTYIPHLRKPILRGIWLSKPKCIWNQQTEFTATYQLPARNTHGLPSDKRFTGIRILYRTFLWKTDRLKHWLCRQDSIYYMCLERGTNYEHCLCVPIFWVGMISGINRVNHLYCLNWFVERKWSNPL